MIGVILAAGMAKRLRPLTNNSPKCLLRVGERSLLQRTVDALIAGGIDELVVVTGYLRNFIDDFLKANYPQLKISFIDNPDYATTNNIYSLWLAIEIVGGKDFILLDSDILFDPEIVARMLRQERTSLAVNAHELGDEEIKVIVDDERNVVELSKTCSPTKAIGESVGIEVIKADYSAALADELNKMIRMEGLCDVFYELAFERLVAQGKMFKAVDTSDLFSIELDTVDDFENAQRTIPPQLF